MIKKNLFRSEQGITLVELVVAVGILSIIIMAVTQLFSTSTQLFSRGEEKSHNQMQIRIAVDEITKDLRYAKDLVMLEDADIPSGPSAPDTDYKYVYFKEDGTDYSLVILEYINSNWIEREFLKGRIDIDRTQDDEKSYFELHDNLGDKSVKFDVTDKSIKHEDSRRFKLSTTVNLLNAESYPPVDPDPQPTPKKYRGIKYKE